MATSSGNSVSKENSTSTGYSGTPLAKKLGIKPASTVLAIDPPKEYRSLLEPLSSDVVYETVLFERVDLVHVFVVHRDELQK